jgi:hypothetical protein
VFQWAVDVGTERHVPLAWASWVPTAMRVLVILRAITCAADAEALQGAWGTLGGCEVAANSCVYRCVEM